MYKSDLTLNWLFFPQAAEEAARAEEEEAELEHEMAEVKKSPSDLSVEVYVSPKGKHPPDVDSKSIKSECGPEFRRRGSVVNSKGKKVSGLQVPHVPVTVLQVHLNLF